MGGQPSGLLCFENKLGMRAAGQVGQLQMQQSATLIGDSPAAKLSVRLKDLQLFSHYLFVENSIVAKIKSNVWLPNNAFSLLAHRQRTALSTRASSLSAALRS